MCVCVCEGIERRREEGTGCVIIGSDLCGDKI